MFEVAFSATRPRSRADAPPSSVGPSAPPPDPGGARHDPHAGPALYIDRCRSTVVPPGPGPRPQAERSGRKWPYTFEPNLLRGRIIYCSTRLTNALSKSHRNPGRIAYQYLRSFHAGVHRPRPRCGGAKSGARPGDRPPRPRAAPRRPPGSAEERVSTMGGRTVRPHLGQAPVVVRADTRVCSSVVPGVASGGGGGGRRVVSVVG